MYFYPEDVLEAADQLLNSEQLSSEAQQFAFLIKKVANEAIDQYGSRASVSIDPSAAVGYALPKRKKPKRYKR